MRIRLTKMLHDSVRVNRNYLPLKATFLFAFGATGSLMDFVTLFFKQLGLSASQVGLMQGLICFTSIPVRILVGILTDITRRYKTFLIGCLVLSVLTHGVLLVIPRLFSQTTQPGRASNNVHVEIECPCSLSSFTEPENCAVCYHLYLSALLLESMHKDMPANNSSSSNYTRTCNFKAITSETSKGSVCVEQTALKAATRTVNVYAVYNTTMVCWDDYLVQAECTVADGRDGTNDTTYLGTGQGKRESSNEPTACNISLTCRDGHASQITTDNDHWSLFGAVFVVFLFCNAFRLPVYDLLNTIMYFSLEDRNDFGRVRLWGSIGYCIMSPASAILLDKFSPAGKVDYSVCFYFFMALCCVTVVFSCCTGTSLKQHDGQKQRNFLGLLRIPSTIVFLTIVTGVSVIAKGLPPFLYWYMNEIGSTQLTIGLVMATRTLAEVVCMYTSGNVISRFGRNRCLYVISGLLALRCFCYSVITNPWGILPVEVISGVVVGLASTVFPLFANIVAPPGMEATLQTLVGACRSGLGKGVGTLVAGVLMDAHTGIGPIWTFRIFGLFAVIILVFSVATSERYLLEPKPSTKDTETFPSECNTLIESQTSSSDESND